MKRADPHYPSRDQRGLLQALVGDGRPLLLFTGLSLILSGGFALFLAATGQFLPHDTRFLGMTAEQLCAVKLFCRRGWLRLGYRDSSNRGLQ